MRSVCSVRRSQACFFRSASNQAYGGDTSTEPGIRGKGVLGVATSTADNSETPIRNTNTPRFAGRS